MLYHVYDVAYDGNTWSSQMQEHRFINCMECHCLAGFTSGDMGNTPIVIFCFPVYGVTIFEINLSEIKFNDQAVFLHDQKLQGRNLNITKQKRAFNP